MCECDHYNHVKKQKLWNLPCILQINRRVKYELSLAYTYWFLHGCKFNCTLEWFSLCRTHFVTGDIATRCTTFGDSYGKWFFYYCLFTHTFYVNTEKFDCRADFWDIYHTILPYCIHLLMSAHTQQGFAVFCDLCLRLVLQVHNKCESTSELRWIPKIHSYFVLIRILKRYEWAWFCLVVSYMS